MKPNNSTHCMTTRSTKINTQEKTSTDNISIIIILINDIILQKNIKNMDHFIKMEKKIISINIHCLIMQR